MYLRKTVGYVIRMIRETYDIEVAMSKLNKPNITSYENNNRLTKKS